MSERGVCICPACGCQFSDDQKEKLERADLITGWFRRLLHRLRVMLRKRKVGRHER